MLEHMDFGLPERLYVQFPCEQDNLLYVALVVGLSPMSRPSLREVGPERQKPQHRD